MIFSKIYVRILQTPRYIITDQTLIFVDNITFIFKHSNRIFGVQNYELKVQLKNVSETNSFFPNFVFKIHF